LVPDKIKIIKNEIISPFAECIGDIHWVLHIQKLIEHRWYRVIGGVGSSSRKLRLGSDIHTFKNQNPIS